MMMMKEFWPQVVVLWTVLLSIYQARCKHLRHKATGSLDTFNHKRKLEYHYPHRTVAYLRFLNEGAKIVGETSDSLSDSQRRFRREKNDSDSKDKRKLGKIFSHHSSLLPQPAKPLRVVATSAVIKNRRKSPRPLKAIHIWGPTPFRTVIENLRRLNLKNIQSQRAAVKRLFLPAQILNAFRKQQLHGRILPFQHPSGSLPLVSRAIHFQSVGQRLPPPIVRNLPGPVQFAPPALEPIPPLDELGPLHTREQDVGPAHDFPSVGPVGEVAPDQEVAGMRGMDLNDVTPVREFGPVHDIGPLHDMAPVQELGPVHEIGPFHDMAPVQEVSPVRDISPMHDVAPVREIDPIHDIGPPPDINAIPNIAPVPDDIVPAPQMVPRTFDISPEMAPNFQPPNSMFAPPFPWLAGEIHENVNRHVHKGKLR